MKKRWGHGQEDVYPVAQFEKLWGDMTGLAEVRNVFADMVGDAGAKVSWWDKHLGTQYAKAEKFPAFKRVFERVQSYIEDVSTLANEAADTAPAILPKLETWKDLKQSFKQYGLSKADAEALGKPVNHIPTSAQCDSRHTNFASFRPAQMSHAGTAG